MTSTRNSSLSLLLFPLLASLPVSLPLANFTPQAVVYKQWPSLSLSLSLSLHLCHETEQFLALTFTFAFALTHNAQLTVGEIVFCALFFTFSYHKTPSLSPTVQLQFRISFSLSLCHQWPVAKIDWIRNEMSPSVSPSPLACVWKSPSFTWFN